MTKRLDMMAAWTDTMAMLRSHIELVVAISGMFFLLPGAVFGWLMLPDAPLPVPETPDERWAQFAKMISDNWPYMIGNAVCTAIGTVALLALILDRARPTVGQAIGIGVVMLPVYLLLTILQGAIMFAGFMLFILPGFYLAARLAAIAPVLVAEKRRNPFEVIARSFAVTRGNGWRVLLFMMVIVVTGLVVDLVLTQIVGIVAMLAIGGTVAKFIILLVDVTVLAALSSILVYAVAAIYRALAVASASRDQSGLA